MDVFGKWQKDTSAKWTLNPAQRYAIYRMGVQPNGFILIKTPAIENGNRWVGMISPWDMVLF